MCVNYLDNDTTLEAITREKEKRGKRRKKYVRLSVRKNTLTLRAWSKKYSIEVRNSSIATSQRLKKKLCLGSLRAEKG